MNRRVGFVILLLALAAGALAVRVVKLPMRPMHTDEAVHAWKLGDLMEHGHYRYNPIEYHGPTLNYLTLPVTWLRGITRYMDLDEQALRIVPAIFGVAMIVLLLGLSDGLGRPACLVAAALTAVSTPMVFYSRYYIMEIPLVAFTLLALVGVWRAIRTGSAGWFVLAGVGVGLMHATKETWVFVPVAAAAGVLAAVPRPGKLLGELPRKMLSWRVALAVGAGVVTAGLFLSSFGTNPRGPLDSILTYAYMARRAVGGGGVEAGDLHVNPWHYYLRCLVYTRYLGRGPIWTEGLIVALALVGTGAGFFRRGLGAAQARLVRFLGVYSFVLLGIYSAIPYKTPWCVLGPLGGMILLAGVGAVALVRWVPTWPVKALVVLALAAGTAHVGYQSYRANFDARFCYSNHNPWVYGHSSRGVVRLGERADELAALHPQGHDLPIKVYAPDPYDHWPLPWYLRRFRHVGYLQTVPDAADAPIIIFKPEVWPELEPKLRGQYQYEHRGLRPTVVLVMGIEKGLWKKYIDRIQQAARAGKERAMSEPDDRPASLSADGESRHRFAHRAMGCIFEILIVADREDRARDAAEAAFEELDRLEKLLSRFDAYSDVARINAAGAGESLLVDVETLECLALARRMWSQTNGAFDVTAGTPENARADVSMRDIEIDPEAFTVQKRDARVHVDLGGIGKGLALDRMAEMLKEWGIATALLHGGSSTVLAVGSAAGQGWRVALRDPFEADAEPLGWVQLADRAFSGSSTAHAEHITDPRTGRAVAGGRAAWAVADSAARADALTTALCVMEFAEARRYAQQHQRASLIVASYSEGQWRMRALGPAILEEDKTDRPSSERG